jgi:hypothetical protein
VVVPLAVSLGEAVSDAELDEVGLTEAVALCEAVFEEELVCDGV